MLVTVHQPQLSVIMFIFDPFLPSVLVVSFIIYPVILFHFFKHFILEAQIYFHTRVRLLVKLLIAG